MVVIDNKATKKLMLDHIESTIQFFSLLRNIEGKSSIEDNDSGDDFEKDLNPESPNNEERDEVILEQMKLFVAGHRNKIEKFQKIVNKELVKKNPKLGELCDYQLNWEELALPEKMSEFEIREKVDTSLDYLSGFFYSLGQSSQTIPLSLGLMRRRSKDAFGDDIIEEEDEEREESVMEISSNVSNPLIPSIPLGLF